MNVIKLKGDELEYWKKHSDLINDLSEWEEDGVLELSRELFPNFSDNDWEFFKRFLHKKDIHYTRSKKYNTFVYNIKNYTRNNAGKVLDFIMYGKKYTDMYNLLNKRKIRLPIRVNNNNNNNENSNNNYNNNNNNEKRPNIVIDNNNNNYMKRIPIAKQRSKSLKKESKKRSKTLKKEYKKSKEPKTIEDIIKSIQRLKKELRETSKNK
jgi:hypothetical protein